VATGYFLTHILVVIGCCLRHLFGNRLFSYIHLVGERLFSWLIGDSLTGTWLW